MTAESDTGKRAGRVLFLTERFPPDPGGVARSAARIARAIAGLGFGLEVLTWTKTLPPGQLDTALFPPGDSLGVAVHRLGLFAGVDFSYQYSINVLEWIHQQAPYNAIWGHFLYPAGFVASLAGETFGLPVTVSARGNDIDRLMFPPGDFARLLWTLDRARVISAVSDDLSRKIAMLLSKPKPVEVIHNAVDLDLFRPTPPNLALRQTLGIGPDELVLGFSGELRLKKGFPFLLRALDDVRQQRPACLLVIGDLRPREQTALSNLTLQRPDTARRIVVTGHLEDPSQVARHLALCDIYLQPSIWDGLPNALLEAMSCGLLVVASDAGGIAEVIQHGHNGFLVPKAHLNRLAEAILEIADLSDERKAELRRAARRRIESDFSPSCEQQALQRVMRRLLP